MTGEKTKWIWKKDRSDYDLINTEFVLFRKSLSLCDTVAEAIIKVSADSRYKLYINGEMVEVGPAKGDSQVWFVDTIDLKSYLRKGINSICVIVLHYSIKHAGGNYGVMRTACPGLYVSGTILCKNGYKVEVSANETWKYYVDHNRKILSESQFFSPLHIYEKATTCSKLFGWMDSKYDDSAWEHAIPYVEFAMSGAVSPGNLLTREIPFMYRKKRCFDRVIRVSEKEHTEDEWEHFIRENKPITIPAMKKIEVEISAGEEMTGYLRLIMEHGADSIINIVQAESYILNEENRLPTKGDREDYKNGYLKGYQDEYKVSGLGCEQKPEIYEPFWFRTFRFIKLDIQTGKEPLTLCSFSYVETGYPLESLTKVKISDKSLEDIWGISKRTLQRCMHETYEDCPYYEQLQYAMDSRMQILCTYSLAADDRLARQCIAAFSRSQRYDGLLNCCYPSYEPNIIPGFSIYYILMLYDHMMYFGDKKLVETYMPTVERILLFFHRHLDKSGCVEKIGGLNMRDRYWSFIDWTKQWDSTTGVPTATLHGAITMESLLYLLGTQKAEKLAEYIGRISYAKILHEREEKITQAILNCCIGSNGMLQDGPGIEEYSQHTQVFAILTNLLEEDRARENLKNTMDNSEMYAQCSVAMSYYLFRALDKVGLYGYTNKCWNLWRDMLAKNLTTCVEDNVNERSDCHAWGALALYEFPSSILGVRPAAPGYSKVAINPHTEYINSAAGEVVTPHGIVSVSWKKINDIVEIEKQIPEGMEE